MDWTGHVGWLLLPLLSGAALAALRWFYERRGGAAPSEPLSEPLDERELLRLALPTPDGVLIELNSVHALLPGWLWWPIAGATGLFSALLLAVTALVLRLHLTENLPLPFLMSLLTLMVGVAFALGWSPTEVSVDVGQHWLTIHTMSRWGRPREQMVELHEIARIERTVRGLTLILADDTRFALPLHGRSGATAEAVRKLLLEHVARASQVRGELPAERAAQREGEG